MDAFVKGGNEMWKMPAKEQEYNVSVSSACLTLNMFR